METRKHGNLEDLLATIDDAGERGRVERLWRGLGELEQTAPPPALAGRFEATVDLLRTAQAGRPRRSWTRFVAAAALLVLGITLGASTDRWLASSSVRAGELAALRAERAGLRRSLSTLLDHRSTAASRLAAIIALESVGEANPAVVEALTDRVLFDPSLGVRLAAVDALHLRTDRSEAAPAMIRALLRSASPLLQAALIDLLTEGGDVSARSALEQLAGDDTADEIVRQKAEQALNALARREA